MRYLKIIKCEILSDSEPRKVKAQFEDMTIKEIFRYYSDELTFLPQELIGLTEEGSRTLFMEKHREYLRS